MQIVRDDTPHQSDPNWELLWHSSAESLPFEVSIGGTFATAANLSRLVAPPELGRLQLELLEPPALPGKFR